MEGREEAYVRSICQMRLSWLAEVAAFMKKLEAKNGKQ